MSTTATQTIGKETITNLMLLKKYKNNLTKEQYDNFKEAAKVLNHDAFKVELFKIVK